VTTPLAAFALVLLLASPAIAQKKTEPPNGPQEAFVRANDSGKVVVWRSESAWKVGQPLLEAKQSDLAAKYVACLVDSGTTVLPMEEGGYRTHRITVIKGKSRGCEGNVATLYSRPKP
jgi:hypothetical protein